MGLDLQMINDDSFLLDKLLKYFHEVASKNFSTTLYKKKLFTKELKQLILSSLTNRIYYGDLQKPYWAYLCIKNNSSELVTISKNLSILLLYVYKDLGEEGFLHLFNPYNQNTDLFINKALIRQGICYFSEPLPIKRYKLQDFLQKEYNMRT